MKEYEKPNYEDFDVALNHIINLAIAGQAYFDPVYSENCTTEGCNECEYGIEKREELNKHIEIVKSYLKMYSILDKPPIYIDDEVVPKMRIIDEESNNAK
jgi:hypothetical protein